MKVIKKVFKYPNAIYIWKYKFDTGISGKMDVQFTHPNVDIPVFFILNKGLQKSGFEREFVEVILARVDETNSPHE